MSKIEKILLELEKEAKIARTTRVVINVGDSVERAKNIADKFRISVRVDPNKLAKHVTL